MEVHERRQIVLTDRVEDYPVAALKALRDSGIPFIDAGAASGEPLDWIREADVLIVTWFQVTKEVLESLQRCRLIVRIGVGYDNIDVDAARLRGIAVCNVPDYCTGEVADHAIAMALSQARALPFLDRCVREGVWKPALPLPMPSFDVMTFGVLGYGRIGRAAIARARGFGFRLIACDPYVSAAEFPSDVKEVALDELLSQADILSVHVPLTAETRHVLNRERLARMRPTAILVNTARGLVIETAALVEALREGRLGAAGLDVFDEEPLRVDHPLLSLPNVLVAPHFAWHSRESRLKLYLMAVEEAIRGVRGEPLRSCVNGAFAPGGD